MEVIKLIEKTFRGKKVFLTGNTGFKGSWLNLWLNNIGTNVKGYSLKPELESLFGSIEKNLDNETTYADIRDKEKLQSEIKKFKPDFIFHLAAKSLVRYSYQHPLDTFETNISGTANLLHSLSKLNNECIVVIITTDKVYQNKEWIYPYRENDELGGFDPYSASKASAEIVTASMRNSFFNISDYKVHRKAISTARAGNVIGGGDYSADRIIPDIVRALKKNKPVEIRNPNSVRPWQYVLEPLYGYLLLAAKMKQEPVKYSGAYNFGPYLDDNLTVEELVKSAIKSWGKGNYKLNIDKKAPHEAGLLRLDISKAILELKWKPVMKSSEAIQKTIEWYRSSFDDPKNNFKLTTDYLNEYIKRIKDN